jgi:uncharacterized protein YjdB
MLGRFCSRALLLASLAVPFIGCGSSTTVDSIQVTPATVSLATGATAQLTATGTYGHGSHPSSSQNITSAVTWSSSATSVATVSSAGVVTGVGAGTTTITASTQGFGGVITSNEASITVTGGGSGPTSSTLTSLALIPGTQSVSSPGQTGQFIAIGTTSSGATEDLTGSVTWSSSSAQVATISVGGLATGVSQGTTTITAIATNPDKTVVTGTATFTVTGGTSEPFTAITISPGAETLSATGQTGQFTAIATASGGLNQDVTNSPQVRWTSSIPTIATVTTSPAPSAGTVAGVSPGSTVITATLTNPDGTVLTANAAILVTASSQAEPLLSITILPGSITLGNLDGTGQFLAYGTFSTPPTVQDITNGINRPGFVAQVNWISALQTLFPITTASGSPGDPSGTGDDGATETDGGLITAYASGTSDVYAVAANPDGTLVYSPAVTFNCPLQPPTATSNGTCNPETIADPLLVTVTVFNAGLNTTNWLVTAPSATGTPNVIHCGPGSVAAGLGNPVCSAPYPIDARVTLTAPAGYGQFGGWSYTCQTISPNPSQAGVTNTCTMTVGNDTSSTNPTSNVSVGAIFN